MASRATFSLPFPTRELADRELTYDPCYAKIPEEDRPRIVEEAWQRGATAARDTFERLDGNTNFFWIFKQEGVRVERRDTDFVSGGQRYFSDYISGQKLVTLYTESVALWAHEHHLAQNDAENIILSHEFYHHLECTSLGLTSRIYQIPMVTIGSIKLGKTGIRALSEIGAHAFSRTYLTLAGLVTEEADEHEAAV